MCNQPGTRTFFTTGPTAYSMLFPGAFFSLKDSSTDNLVTLMENNREAWLVEERPVNLVRIGRQNFYFSRLPGVGPQIGCAAKHSIARCGSRLAWLGRNEQGQNIVVGDQQLQWVKISTVVIDAIISTYPLIQDAIGYGYEEGGHVFYVLAFPTADVTWVFDFTTGRNEAGTSVASTRII